MNKEIDGGGVMLVQDSMMQSELTEVRWYGSTYMTYIHVHIHTWYRLYNAKPIELINLT